MDITAARAGGSGRVALAIVVALGCSACSSTPTLDAPATTGGGGGSSSSASTGGCEDCPPPVDCGGFSNIVAPSTPTHPRNTEGDVVVLADGRLLLAYSRFLQGGDHDPAEIIGVISDDGGRTWADEHVLAQNDQGSMSAMVASFVRLQDGRILLGYNKQVSLADTRYYVRTSADEGQTWSPELLVVPDPRYGFVYNFAPIQLASGRILAPYAFNEPGPYVPPGHVVATIFYSDDGAASWSEIATPVDLPMRGAMEPGVIELADGTLFMYLRTQLGNIYRSLSTDQGLTWSAAEATSLLNPESASAMTRIPGSNDILAIYNDNYDVDGPHHFGARTPLTAARSSDGGETWTKLLDIEADPTREYSYPSITFDGDRLLLSYYETALGGFDQRFRSMRLSELLGVCPRAE